MATAANIACLAYIAAIAPLQTLAEDTTKIIQSEFVYYKYENENENENENEILNEEEFREKFKKLHPFELYNYQRHSRTVYQYDGKPIEQNQLIALLNSKPASQQALENLKYRNYLGNFLLGVGLFLYIKSGNEPKPNLQRGGNTNSYVDQSFAPMRDIFWGTIFSGVGVGFKFSSKNISRAIRTFNGELPFESSTNSNGLGSDPSPF